jgi:glycogen phosphorylase
MVMIGNISESRQVFKLKKLFIENKLPKGLEKLEILAGNLWWSWDREATHFFSSIQPGRWEQVNYNPLAIINDLSSGACQKLLDDKEFLKKLNRIYDRFEAYINQPIDDTRPSVTYFSMEYGLHISLRLYSGGLGVLAGDFLKEASDCSVNMVAVGLLYRYGYFQQTISLHGDQINEYPPQKFTELPLSPVRDAHGDWIKISIRLRGREVFAKVWQLNVGRIPLYLLDADIDENSWEDRALTHQLYGGDNEHRLKQEILLGIGGIRALKAMGIQTNLYHCNEGHAAFMGLERIKGLMDAEGLSFDVGQQIVRSSSLFTTHTPVPAGHDHFEEGLLKEYFEDYVKQLEIEWDQFTQLGKEDNQNTAEDFSMSHLAIRLSGMVNGVSKLHGQVSRDMFKTLYPGYSSDEIHIGHVTNSVHLPTWIAPEWLDLYDETFGSEFRKNQSDRNLWYRINDVQSARIYSIRKKLRTRLLDKVVIQMKEDLLKRGESPSSIFQVIKGINPNALVIGFARRFATYKRAHLLFTNLERLSKIVNHPDRPVIFLFSGKAHPADKGGQALIKNIVEISRRPEFQGKIIFLEGYNMELAKYLVQGVDIWLNTPTRPLEASGTSGMKATINGVLNFSVLDGWWAEGYIPEGGWSLPMERTYKDQSLQDQLDAELIYNMFETEIIPNFFESNDQGISEKWVGFIKKNIAEIAPNFTMKRMLDDYYAQYYHPLYQSAQKMNTNNFLGAFELADWKQKLKDKWSGLRRTDIRLMDTENESLILGEPFSVSLEIFLNGLEARDISVEVLMFRRIDDHKMELKLSRQLNLEREDNGTAVFACEISPEISGVLEYGFRIHPSHPLLQHKQEIELVKWV